LTELKITEIFYSLQGETRTIGLPTLFIRLTGCPLRCSYCDSDYAFTGGKIMTINEIVSEASNYQAPYITVTGGEPLAQTGVHNLLSKLCELPEKPEVSIETAGALDISGVDPRVVKVVDWKTPDSGESHRNRPDIFRNLQKGDTLKFVLCSRLDYEWAKFQLGLYKIKSGVEVVFSPSFESLNATTIAEWVLKDRLNVRVQIQLHKILWNDKPGH
tara:strand:+ start:3139 stop:3786 length:648 start_codon:yes stop_codon:yes gene_type:complete